MDLVVQCLRGFLRVVVLFALIIFVALPDNRSTVPDLVSNELAANSTDMSSNFVDDGHDHSDIELIFGHCDEGLDCTVVAAFFSQPTLVQAVTLAQLLARPSGHKLASLSWPYDPPPPRIIS
jgi:hypothetical protein